MVSRFRSRTREGANARDRGEEDARDARGCIENDEAEVKKTHTKKRTTTGRSVMRYESESGAVRESRDPQERGEAREEKGIDCTHPLTG